MGEMSCGAWPKAAKFDDPEKASVLNWVLGFMSRASGDRGLDLMANVDVPSISAWMDNYCAAHPLDTKITGSYVLERELVARTAPPPVSQRR
jgi:hypothetical protein